MGLGGVLCFGPLGVNSSRGREDTCLLQPWGSAGKPPWERVLPHLLPGETWPASPSMGHPDPRRMAGEVWGPKTVLRLVEAAEQQGSGGDLEETGNAGGPAQGFL